MKVSICLITYNHEAYIEQAIESILNQVTTFDTELVIGEDFSTDGTLEICLKYARQYPDKIKLLDSERNLGMIRNFYRTYQNCDGEYIAYIEGDDYWNDDHKLQIQTDFLIGNPSYSACFHNVNILQQRDGGNGRWPLHQSLTKDRFNTRDLLGPWFVPSPSFVFVNYRDFVLPDWFHLCRYGDLPFMLLLSLRGDFKYFPEIMASYRLHDQGMTTLDKKYDKVILMTFIYENFNIQTQYRYKDEVRQAVRYEFEKHVLNDEHPVLKMRESFIEKLKKKISRIIKPATVSKNE